MRRTARSVGGNVGKQKATGCAVCTLSGCIKVPGEGPDNPVLAVVGEGPGAQELRQSRPFVGPSGRLLTTALLQVGAARGQVYLTNSTLCAEMPPRTPKAKEVACCVPRLVDELKAKQPRVILAMGKTAIKALLGTNKPLAEERGSVHQAAHLGALVVTTYHPAAVLRNPRLHRDMQADIQKAWHLATDQDAATAAVTPLEIRYSVINDRITLVAFLNKAHRYETVSLDVETASTGECLCLGVSVEPGQAVVVPVTVLHENQDLLQAWLRSKKIIGQNVKYDINVLRATGITGLRTGGDTMLQSYVLSPFTGRHGLKQLVREHLDYYEDYSAPAAPYIKTMEECPTELMYKYNAYDAVLTLLLYHVLEAKLDADAHRVLDNLLYPASDVLAEMEFLGVKVDTDYLKELDVVLAAEIASLIEQMHSVVGEEFNPNSYKQLMEIMYGRLELPIPARLSTDKAALELIAQLCDHEFPKLLLSYRERTKFHSTYVRKLSVVADSQGRVHTRFNLHTTVTGRLSSSTPVNLQNITRGSEARNIFVATPGYTLIECDLKQAEIRGWCWYSRDEDLKAAILSGTDIHTATASLMFELSPEEVTKEQRTQAKRLSFGTLYQMSPQTLAGELRITVPDAIELQQRYFSAFQRGEEWIREIQQQVLRDGFFVTPFGRRLRFIITPETASEVSRQAVNYPIQSLCSDITLSALIRLGRRIEAEELGDTRLLLTVHDSILLETKENPYEIAALVEQEITKDVLDGWMPFTADVVIGKKWGALGEVNLLEGVH